MSSYHQFPCGTASSHLAALKRSLLCVNSKQVLQWSALFYLVDDEQGIWVTFMSQNLSNVPLKAKAKVAVSVDCVPASRYTAIELNMGILGIINF